LFRVSKQSSGKRDCDDGKAAREAYVKDLVSPLEDWCYPRNVVAGPD
jgi:hypothetical protein